jgi:hypothetical protein
MLGGPGDNRGLADNRCSVREREHWKLLLSADPFEAGAFAGRAEGARAALAEDDAFVFDSRLVESLVSATAPVGDERRAAASNVAGVEGQFVRGVL